MKEEKIHTYCNVVCYAAFHLLFLYNSNDGHFESNEPDLNFYETDFHAIVCPSSHILTLKQILVFECIGHKKYCCQDSKFENKDNILKINGSSIKIRFYLIKRFNTLDVEMKQPCSNLRSKNY